MKPSIKRMLAPESTAVVGASENEGYGGRLMKNLLAHGYKGKLYPVNPKYNKVLGLKAFPSLEWIKGDIDLAILILRAELIPQLLRQCEHKKVGSVLIISAGFREEGSEKGI
jgi:acetyltransferase